MHKLLIGLLFLLPLSFSNAQTASARRIVQQLCSPEFHGRGYVNNGDKIAADFIRKEFETMGCQFFKNGPFQPFSFTVNSFPSTMNVSLNGKLLQPGTDYVVDPASGGGTAENLEAVFVSSENVSSEEKLVAFLAEMKPRFSKRKVILVFDMPAYTKEEKERASEFLPAIAAIAPVAALTDTKFTWSVSGESLGFPFLHIQRDKVDRSAPLKLAYDIVTERREHTANNVIAYVPAKKKSKKYFVYTAHYDHLGRMGSATYFPGGNDNASGTAMLIELARHYQANPLPDVNVVFMAFAGEEAGLFGSKYYTEHPLFPLKEISFLFNIDIMGSGEEGATVVNATVFPEQFRVLENINTEKNYLVKIGKRGEAANSDHYFFTKAGVPAFFLYTMGPNKHYHDVLDTYEELSFAEFDDLFHLLLDFGTAIGCKSHGKK